MKNKLYLLIFLFICCNSAAISQQLTDSVAANEYRLLKSELLKKFLAGPFSFKLPSGIKIDTVFEETAGKTLYINFNQNISFLPLRENSVDEINRHTEQCLPPKYSGYKVIIKSGGYRLNELIPNFYRKTLGPDKSRLPVKVQNRQPQVIRNISKPYKVTAGLQNRNIIAWHSHGWYYDKDAGRWEWQRPRLFQMVEDFVPMSFVIPYLLPMLENAGANTYVPRERDIQYNEVVVDNDTPGDIKKKAYREISATKVKSGIRNGVEAGFRFKAEYDSTENPFYMGSYRIMSAGAKATRQIEWIPIIPETGEYAVYFSYKRSPDNVQDAHYTIFHEGGKTEFLVNQQIGGASWYYAGTFKFLKGSNPASGKVVLTNETAGNGSFVTADAVRFGGGMGNIIRDGETSGRPKFTEGSRYWLQYAGMPDSLVYHFGNVDDYTDDYRSRPEYGNFLHGDPYGPTRDKKAGLGIPMDLSLAFHTDAGITNNDTVVGVLSIYRLKGNDGKLVFPDSVSRMANRDFADILQTEIVTDIRASFDSAWTRRQLRDGDYSESSRPNMPSALLELLSHQNFLDMRFVQDPSFRFTVARSIYKAMLKYLASANGDIYSVAPLPVTHVSALLQKNGSVKVSWRPVTDSLEPTAVPSGYVVYRRINDGGFDNGVYSDKNEFVFTDIIPGKIYSFKVTAVNAGGESMPSEIVAAAKGKAKTEVLIVNSFHRVSGPSWVESKGFAGFTSFLDEGVPDKYFAGQTGLQIDYNTASELISNDAPGHGASGAENEGRIIAGNSFDYPYVHGQSILNAGYSFSSCSDAAITNNMVSPAEYKVMDIIGGEQKGTQWPKESYNQKSGLRYRLFSLEFLKAIAGFLANNGSLIISGSYIASDAFLRQPADTILTKLIKDTLRFTYQADHACKNGNVSAKNDKIFPKGFKLHFNNLYSRNMYKVEAPDAIRPAGGARSILYYDENSFSAGIFYKKTYGVAALGFPFESIDNEKTRDDIMRCLLTALLK